MEKRGHNEKCFQRVRIASCLVVFLLLAFQSSGVLAESLEEGAKREGKVMYYSQLNVPDLISLLAPFQKKYPFLKAEYYRAGSIPIANKALAENRMGKTFADVISTSGSLTNLLIKEGLIGKYISPESKFLHPGFQDREGFWTAFYMQPYSFIYNTKMVATKDIPKTYEDLLNPKWKGKIGLSLDELDWFIGMLDFMGEEKGIQFMKRLAEQNLMLRNGRSLIQSLLMAGEFPLALGVTQNVIRQKRQGAPVDLITFPVPTLATMRMVSILANAPHPNATRLLVDYILSKEGQSILTQGGRDSVRTDVPSDPEVEKIMRNPFPIKPREAEATENYKKEFLKIFLKR